MQNLKMKYCISVYMCVCVIISEGWTAEITRKNRTDSCNPPPFIRYGEVRIDSRTEESTFFRKGSLVTYSCAAGFSLVPPNSRIRECRDGLWTGIQGTCVSDGCPWPANITNGYFVLEAPAGAAGGGGGPGSSLARVGQRAHYNCNLGFALWGEPTQQCVDSGEWSRAASRPAAAPRPRLPARPRAPQPPLLRTRTTTTRPSPPRCRRRPRRAPTTPTQ
ncbi:Furrowed, partial [Gryllus bimaculatus]